MTTDEASLSNAIDELLPIFLFAALLMICLALGCNFVLYFRVYSTSSILSFSLQNKETVYVLTLCPFFFFSFFLFFFFFSFFYFFFFLLCQVFYKEISQVSLVPIC